MALRQASKSIGIWILLALAGSTSSVGLAQVTGPASLGYKLTMLGKDAYGISVLQAGDVFSIKTPGILGVLPTQHSVCPMAYRDGVLQKPGSFCVSVERSFSAYFQPGLKVYFTKLDVNLKKGRIDVSITACDGCNKTEPASYYRSEVDFEFEKGYLETAKPEVVKATIAQVFALDVGGEVQSTATGGLVPNSPGPAPLVPAAVPVIHLNLPSTYVNAQTPADQLQLNADNSFSLQEAGQTYRGTFAGQWQHVGTQYQQRPTRRPRSRSRATTSLTVADRHGCSGNKPRQPRPLGPSPEPGRHQNGEGWSG